jgi:pyridoxamine 5'-phosphate oxidase
MSKPQPIRPPLREEDTPSDPLLLFTEWWQEASASEQVYEHHAATLATVAPDGRPSARVVLMRGYDERGFCFYTNYESRKGAELAHNPYCSLLFWWGALGRQIRIEGRAERMTAEESDAYFDARPLDSRLSAIISPQSQVVPSRAKLEADLAQLAAEFRDHEPVRPAFWGGYRIIPAVFEFWQSGPNRLHDRLAYYRQVDGEWLRARLAP